MSKARRQGDNNMTLTDFLLARIADDEEIARSGPTDWMSDDVESEDQFAQDKRHDRQPHRFRCAWRTGEGLQRACDCDYPAHILAECKAKRRIVALHALTPGDGDEGCGLCNWADDYGWAQEGPCDTVLALASVYADHPDYRDEWRP